jgi:threonyl-tRNA synthetase
MLVIGDEEMANGTVSVRSRKEANMGSLSMAELMDKIIVERDTKAK